MIMVRTGLPLMVLLSGITALAADTQVRADHGLVAEKVLFAVPESLEQATLTTSGVSLSIVETTAGRALHVRAGHRVPWPGVTIPVAGGPVDLSSWRRIEAVVRNAGTDTVRVHCRVDDPQGDGNIHCRTSDIELAPGETGAIVVPIEQRSKSTGIKLFAMRGFPEGMAPTDSKAMDPAHVSRFIVFLSKPEEDHAFEVLKIAARGEYSPPPWTSWDAKRFFPMIDEYGQFIHSDWPGKTHSDSDLAACKAAEEKDLESHPAPKNWDRYGGCSSGPALKATGFFRVERYGGKWWLVDPEGRLFWSHGIDCVGPYFGMTPITRREHWFRNLPAPGTPAAQFYGTGTWAPHNDYEGQKYQIFDFSARNLWVKYGGDWRAAFGAITCRRLSSWSLNTIGNWSDAAICRLQKVPYVRTVGSEGARSIEGTTGYWGTFPDPFDPSHRKGLQRSVGREGSRGIGDPWCVGYFVDNELSWGDELSLAVGTLISPADQPAKQAFLEDLQRRYGTIERLNSAWGTSHESWQALQKCREAPDAKRAMPDLTAFTTRLAETYFRNCREAVKQAAPNHLYLGCRFSAVNGLAVRAAAKYCDVISYNLYRRSVETFALPAGMDRPVIIGEFHFGALDRGKFHTGLVPTENQAARAAAYRDYVTGALRNPCLVGAHWFEYMDEATTGRGDGENYQIGFLDTCDTPYPEIIAVAREIGKGMYESRIGAKEP